MRLDAQGAGVFRHAFVAPDSPGYVEVEVVATGTVGGLLIERNDINLKGTCNAFYVLATGIFCALCVALLTPGNFIFMHVLLGFWVMAQLVEIGSQLYFYRMGA